MVVEAAVILIIVDQGAASLAVVFLLDAEQVPRNNGRTKSPDKNNISKDYNHNAAVVTKELKGLRLGRNIWLDTTSWTIIATTGTRCA